MTTGTEGDQDIQFMLSWRAVMDIEHVRAAAKLALAVVPLEHIAPVAAKEAAIAPVTARAGPTKAGAGDRGGFSARTEHLRLPCFEPPPEIAAPGRCGWDEPWAGGGTGSGRHADS